MGLFSGISDAKVSEGGNYLKPGIYPELEVKGFKAGRTRKGEDFVVASLRVCSSSGPTASPAGSVVDWMVMLKHDAALGNIKAFLAAVANESTDAIDEEVAEASLGEEQPLVGLKVSAEAVNIETRSGGTFTKVRWYPHDPAAVAPPPPPAPKPSIFGKK